MMMDAMAMLALFTARFTGETTTREPIPEPEFKPFRFDAAEDERAA